MAFIDHFIVCEFSYAVCGTILVVFCLYCLKLIYWAAVFGIKGLKSILRNLTSGTFSNSFTSDSDIDFIDFGQKISKINYYHKCPKFINILITPSIIYKKIKKMSGPILDFTPNGLCYNCCFCFRMEDAINFYFSKIIPERFRKEIALERKQTQQKIEVVTEEANPLNITPPFNFADVVMMHRMKRSCSLASEKKLLGGRRSSFRSSSIC